MVHLQSILRVRSRLVFFVLIGSFLFSCADITEDEPFFLTVSPKTINLTTNNSEIKVSVNTNFSNWYVEVNSSASEWITVNKNENDITVVAKQNVDFTSREGNIIVKAGKLAETVEISQLGRSPVIIVSDENFSIPHGGGNISFEITSNVEYDLVINNEGSLWVELLKRESNALTGTTLHEYRVLSNNTVNGRQTEITVQQKGGPYSKNITVVQEARAYNGNADISVYDDSFDPLVLFTDYTCTELKPHVTAEDIENVSNSFYKNIAFFLFHGAYPGEFRIQEYQAWPHPSDWAKANKTSTLNLLDNPTGISVSENDTLVFFTGDTGGYSLQVKIQNLDKPNGDGYNDGLFYPVVSGVNRIKVQKKGLVYILYHTPDFETAPDVKVHFATGKVNGYYDSRKHQPSDWSRLLHATVDDYFDVLGEHAHITFPSQDFKTYAATNGDKLIDAYDDLVRLEKEFMGLVKYNRPTINRAYFHAMYTSYMYATSYRTAYNVTNTAEKRNLLDVNQLKQAPWGPAHEVGHIFQTRPGFKWHGMTEVSNNVHSLYVQTQWENESHLEKQITGEFSNIYEKSYFNFFVNNTPHPGEEDVFCKLVSLWQLQLYFAHAKNYPDFYKDYYEKVRTSPNLETDGEQQLEFVKTVCDLTTMDLTGFFKRWGYLTPFNGIIDDYGEKQFKVTQGQIDQVIAEVKANNYPVPDEKIEYICDSNWHVFKNKLAIRQGTATASGKRVTMTSWENVVAYEVYRNNNLVFVSNKSTFQLQQAVDSTTEIYAISYNGNKTKVNI